MVVGSAVPCDFATSLHWKGDIKVCQKEVENKIKKYLV